MKDDLINAGAIYTDLPAVIDKNIITTAHYKDMGPWMREVIKKINPTNSDKSIESLIKESLKILNE